MLFWEICNCRLCGSPDFVEVLDLGSHTLSGRFPLANEPDPPLAPLVLIRCKECGLVQLRHSVNADEMYGHGHAYGYRSGINQTMRGHLAGITAHVSEIVGLKAGDLILDIGSNDSTLLRSYPVQGLDRLGIDPTIEQFKHYYPDDIVTVADYFTAAAFQSVANGRKARAITSIAMFYDLPDPNAFAADICAALAEDGIWVFEQSYLPTMLERKAFDSICHEHLEYYGLAQIDRIVTGQGMRVFDLSLNDINGGSIRIYACHANGPYATRPIVAETLAREKSMGLDTAAPYETFRKDVEAVMGQLTRFVAEETAKGKVIHLYGASTKGNTILQYCGLDRRHIQAAADRNPDKCGRRTPATGIPIISEEESRAAKPDYFLVLPWHFKDEFVAREQAFRDNGGKLIFPLPEFSVI